MNDKNEIRKLIKEKREALSIEDKAAYDEAIFNKIILLEQYKNSKIIFIYVSFDKEVDTFRIINHALENNKTICVPKVISKSEGMKAVKIESINELTAGKYGILEPKESNNIINADKIDLIISPGVAFDSSGYRVGYGGGFYDRFLSNVNDNVPVIAMSYDFQFIDKVPREDFDKPVDFVVTN
ncbi:MAG: 5-formyltetrahydrofolate cyclo-ligase [Bacillota bacterium]|nr:5-formyltetrahydrofolate cyclo-ligase [Bacillota bacterium]